MKANHIPSHVQSKLDQLTQQVEHFTEQAARTKDAIAGARQRLSGGFQSDQEFRDLRVSLDQLVADQPILERKLRDAQFTLADCKAWLEALPSDAVLEPVPPAKSDDGLTLEDARRRIADATDEIAQLRAIPTPGADIRERIEEYVAALPRPRVSGIASGQQLRVDWPNNVIAVMALLLPEQTTKVLLQEVERHANIPMPLDQRKKKITELEAQVDTLQRLALTLGADPCLMSAQAVLGVRTSRSTKRAA